MSTIMMISLLMNSIIMMKTITMMTNLLMNSMLTSLILTTMMKITIQINTMMVIVMTVTLNSMPAIVQKHFAIAVDNIFMNASAQNQFVKAVEFQSARLSIFKTVDAINFFVDIVANHLTPVFVINDQCVSVDQCVILAAIIILIVNV